MINMDLVKRDALHYLGFTKTSIEVNDLITSEILDKAIIEISHLNSFKFTYKLYEIHNQENTVYILNSSIAFLSSSLSEFLKVSDRIALFAATLGIESDRMISAMKIMSMHESLIFDAAASAFLEHKCNEAQSKLLVDEIGASGNVTRFSPGYGDLLLECNDIIINLLNAQKCIGLTSTATHMLVPKKSIVAIIGLNSLSDNSCYNKCKDCIISDSCKYNKKEGNIWIH